MTITTPVENPQGKYKFELTFMSGDADAYETETLIIDENDPDLERFADFVLACSKLNPNTPRERCYKVKDYDYFEEAEGGECSEDTSLCWPYDEHGDCPQRFTHFKVTYFNSVGTEFNVEVSDKSLTAIQPDT